MKFKVTAARLHPLEGLELADKSGVWYATDTKWSWPEAGVVHFVAWGDGPSGECPYKVSTPALTAVMEEERAVNGTDDPVAVAIARDAFEGKYPLDGDRWVNIALPESD